ncbi:MAG: hypothetical protein J1F05_08085 [Muribaculaceae bacterium]|nr:hypothetical protein [Muribaculaceae bacterium]
MSEKEYTSYRFNDTTDPTDEQLAELMRRAAADARENGRKATEKFFDELYKACEEAKQRSLSNTK